MAKKDARMTVAVPVREGEFCEHFGGAEGFAFFVGALGEGKAEPVRELPAPEHRPGAYPNFLADCGADAVVVGSMGERALSLLTAAGIDAFQAQEPGEPWALAAACLAGQLPRLTSENACRSHDHHHEGHDHHGRHGDHDGS